MMDLRHYRDTNSEIRNLTQRLAESEWGNRKAPGSWGARGRGFESRRPDHYLTGITEQNGSTRSPDTYRDSLRLTGFSWVLLTSETQTRHKVRALLRRAAGYPNARAEVTSRQALAFQRPSAFDHPRHLTAPRSRGLRARRRADARPVHPRERVGAFEWIQSRPGWMPGLRGSARCRSFYARADRGRIWMARFEGGYIKWYRKAYFGDIGSNIHCLGLWVALLSMATWKESKMVWLGQQRMLPPGSVVIGIRELAKQLSCSKDTVLRWLRYLVSTQRICVEHATRGTLVTILNWEEYQSLDDGSEKPAAPGPDTDETPAGHGAPPLVGRQPTLSEEDKKRRKKNSPRREYPTEFEEIYRSYPKQEGKKAGFEVYSREIRSEADRTELIRAIENYRKRKQGTDAQYLLMFSTFMNQWTDWLDEKAGTTQLNPQPKLKGLKELEAELG